MDKQTRWKLLFFSVMVGMFGPQLCRPTCSGWIWIKDSCGGVADSILVVVQMLSFEGIPVNCGKFLAFLGQTL